MILLTNNELPLHAVREPQVHVAVVGPSPSPMDTTDCTANIACVNNNMSFSLWPTLSALQRGFEDGTSNVHASLTDLASVLRMRRYGERSHPQAAPCAEPSLRTTRQRSLRR